MGYYLFIGVDFQVDEQIHPADAGHGVPGARSCRGVTSSLKLGWIHPPVGGQIPSVSTLQFPEFDLKYGIIAAWHPQLYLPPMLCLSPLTCKPYCTPGTAEAFEINPLISSTKAHTWQKHKHLSIQSIFILVVLSAGKGKTSTLQTQQSGKRHTSG